ncbi:cobalt ECF transporter T component CbiQ [Chloroflexia bacterium SDU3-3]|nr:cobalt ECF transporter T component CbiQ [Chloroflexia bacterium SDU3-3]
MNLLYLDRYEQRRSRIHQLTPQVKIAATVAFILSNSLLPDGAWLALLLSWGGLLACNRLAGVGYGYTLRRSFVALPFALAALSVIVALPGRPLLAFALGPWHMVATDAGLVRFASIVARSWLSVQMAILLAATTSFPDLTHGLRHLRMPPLLVEIVSFMYRYLAVLLDEAARLMRARDSRSARLPGVRGGGSLGWRASTAGHMAGQLFLRSYERSDRVYNAMLARGFQGEFRTISEHAMRRADWLALAALLASIALIQIIGRIA